MTINDQIMEISAVLPAYNEVNNLAEVVRGLLAALREVASHFEIIIVDDGSEDGTKELADSLARENDSIRVVHHQTNLGYGAALRSGFAIAGLPWIFFTDADGQFEPREISKLVSAASGHGFAAGIRLKRADPWRRRVYGLLFSAAVR